MRRQNKRVYLKIGCHGSLKKTQCVWAAAREKWDVKEKQIASFCCCTSQTVCVAAGFSRAQLAGLCSLSTERVAAALLCFDFSFWLSGMCSRFFSVSFVFLYLGHTCLTDFSGFHSVEISLPFMCWYSPQMWNPVVARCFSGWVQGEGVWRLVYVFALSLKFWPLHRLLLIASNLLI